MSEPEPMFYNGKPCKECGRPLRYISTGRCVKCKRALGRQSYLNNKRAVQLQRLHRRLREFSEAW